MIQQKLLLLQKYSYNRHLQLILKVLSEDNVNKLRKDAGAIIEAKIFQHKEIISSTYPIIWLQ